MSEEAIDEACEAFGREIDRFERRAAMNERPLAVEYERWLRDHNGPF